MTRALICLLTFALLVPVVARAEPAHGMIRAETALPRTFPWSCACHRAKVAISPSQTRQQGS